MRAAMLIMIGVVAAGSDGAAGPRRSAVLMNRRTALTAPGKILVYIGTYTQRGSRGVYLSNLDMKTGELSTPTLAAETKDPTFLAIHQNRKFLYAANEITDFDGKPAGAVSAYRIDAKSGKLTLINQQSSRGQGPCHLIVDRSGNNVLVANYGGGSVACLPINPDGSLGPSTSFVQHGGSSVNKQRQEGPHAHSINVDAANRFAFAADLGLDQIIIYKFDADKSELNENNPHSARVAPGSGPRHFAFHPNGRFAYVINEMSSTVTAFSFNGRNGGLTEFQTISTLPSGYTGSTSCAEVQVHPSGKFLYGSNRGHDSIAIFSIDQSTGKLTAIGHQSTEGKTPRNFAIDPSGTFLLAENQDSNSVVVFRIDPLSGKLAATGHRIDVPMPVCIKMLAVTR